MSVEKVGLDDVTEPNATAAGFDTRAALLERLGREREGTLYRIRLAHLGPDPRTSLRRSVPDEDEAREIIGRLERLDARSNHGPRTLPVLRVIQEKPGIRAAELADRLGMEKNRLKANVRKLKAFGLTESLEVGYRLSPRGAEVLRWVSAPND